jgi:hypothetical protein
MHVLRPRPDSRAGTPGGAHGTYESDRYGLVTDGTDWRTQLFGWADGSGAVVTDEDHQRCALGRMPWWVLASTLTSGVVPHTAVVVLRRAIAIRRSTREDLQ